MRTAQHCSVTDIPTVADAIRAEMKRRDIIQARAAEEMGMSPPKLNGWLVTDAEPQPESYETIARFLRLASVYELGPMIVATKLRRAGLRAAIEEGRR